MVGNTRCLLGLIVIATMFLRRTCGFLLSGDDCPYGFPCICSFNTIYCQGKGLEQIPDLIQNLTHLYEGLDISQNRITSIPAAAFRNLTVDRLEIGPNPIASFSEDAFIGADVYSLTLASIPGLTHIPSSVGQLNNLQRLFVYSTNITGLGETLMSQIGDTLEYLSVGNTKITTWPTSLRLATKLQELHAGGNKYVSIPDNAFDGFYKTLATLDLGNCDLKTLPKAAFRKLENLQELNLERNPLVTIPEDSFLPNIQNTLTNLVISYTGLKEIPVAVQRLNKLQDLGICPNPLVSLINDSFGGLTKTLKTLFMTGCGFVSVPSAIKTLTNLRSLLWDDSALAVIDNDVFNGLSLLRRLDLNQNNLGNISDHAFRGLPSLIELQLSQSHIKQFPAALHDLAKLETLILYGNEITRIPNNAMMGLKSLRKMFMSNNPVSVIEPEALKGATSLTLMDVSHGELNTVPVAITNLISFRGIDLRENPVECNCDLKLIKHKKPYLEVDGQCANVPMTISKFIQFRLSQC